MYLFHYLQNLNYSISKKTKFYFLQTFELKMDLYHDFSNIFSFIFGRVD